MKRNKAIAAPKRANRRRRVIKQISSPSDLACADKTSRRPSKGQDAKQVKKIEFVSSWPEAEKGNKRGKKRTQPGYHASRGWFYKPIQKVIKKWDVVFGREYGREITNETFHQLRGVMESGRGHLEIEIKDAKHRKFVCELMTALDKLYDPENIHGWVVKVWPLCNYDNQPPTPLTYSQVQGEIISLKGPSYSTDALRKAAKRMSLTSSGISIDLQERSVLNPNISLLKSPKSIRA